MSGTEPYQARQVAVVGGGWAGCAAALELASRGHTLTLYEAARTLGGRARRVELDGRQLDNGQHILLGAYRECLRLMRMTGIDPEQALLRLPLQMRYPIAGIDAGAGIDLRAPRLPAPWHLAIGLLRARGLTRQEKLDLVRLFTSLRWMGWRLEHDCSVTEFLLQHGQGARVVRLLWQPLCIAALNTAPELASAQVFLHVLRDSLGARRAASDMLVPRVDLTALFPQQAAHFLERHGHAVQMGANVTRITRTSNELRDQWQVELANGASSTYDAVILAVHPAQLAALAGSYWNGADFPVLAHEPIATCYLQYDPQLRLPAPMLALADDATRNAWGQFVFDRGQLDPDQAGLLAVVVSTATPALEQGQEQLAQGVARQLASQFALPALAQPAWSKVVTEKRATFSCTPNLQRPGNDSGAPGLLIAGDYTAGDYPATLEGAVRSGIDAARMLRAS